MTTSGDPDRRTILLADRSPTQGKSTWQRRAKVYVFLTSASVLLFVGLSVGDAWLTNQLLTRGWQEINPIVRPYGTNMLIKGALALAVALVLVRFGKTKLLRILNIFMLVLVLWLAAGLLHIL